MIFLTHDTNSIIWFENKKVRLYPQLLKISPGYIYRMDQAAAYNGQIYKLVCNDGHYYIGSTKSELKYRLYQHRQHSLLWPDRKVYEHILTCGWDTVKIECVEKVSCTSRDELRKKENEYIKNSLSDPLCLNMKVAHLTKKELLQQQKEYIQTNKENVDAYHKNYRIENAAERAEYSRKYAAEHREAVKATKKAYYEQHKEEIIEKQKAYVEANKDVVKLRKKEWAEKNKEHLEEKRKKYAEENKEAIQERGKEYYEKNKNVIKEKLKVYREENKEKAKEYMKAYREQNREKLSESHTCDCGGKYTKNHEDVHKASKRHVKFVASTSPSTAPHTFP